MNATQPMREGSREGNATSQGLTAGGVREVAGLSYRQLHDWDKKGVLPNGREDAGSWRRYSPRDVFTIMVLSEIRSRFGVPLPSLSWLRDFMLQEGADHFRVAVDIISALGVSVYVVTDLETTFMMESDVELGTLFRMGAFGGDHDQACIFVKVNPLVNRLLQCLENPVTLEQHGLGYRIANAPVPEMLRPSSDEREDPPLEAER